MVVISQPEIKSTCKVSLHGGTKCTEGGHFPLRVVCPQGQNALVDVSLEQNAVVENDPGGSLRGGGGELFTMTLPPNTAHPSLHM